MTNMLINIMFYFHIWQESQACLDIWAQSVSQQTHYLDFKLQFMT